VIYKHSGERERGVVLVLFVGCMGLCMAFLVFAADIARVLCEKRKLQMVADIAALSALNRLGDDTSYARVFERVVSVASLNGFTATEVTEIRPRCGTWTAGIFVRTAADVCDDRTNSVEVTVRRRLPLFFPDWFSRDSVLLEGRAVSYQPPSVRNCIRPFGIEESALSEMQLSNGSIFTISGTQSSGNWGKIDLDGNSSSGTVYTDLMLNNLCSDAFTAGNWVSAGTGNAQISQVFQTLLSDQIPPLAGSNLVLAVTSDFPRGNGVVQIRRFMRVDILAERGSGQGWSSTMRVVELDAQPDSTTQQTRQLVQ
jgi:hypothetical protein